MKSNFTNDDPQSLFLFDISRCFGEEYVPYLDDLFRMVMIQLSIQFMFFIMDPSKYQLFSQEFLTLLLYVVLGVTVYWLVFKKIIQFK